MFKQVEIWRNILHEMFCYLFVIYGLFLKLYLLNMAVAALQEFR